MEADAYCSRPNLHLSACTEDLGVNTSPSDSLASRLSPSCRSAALGLFHRICYIASHETCRYHYSSMCLTAMVAFRLIMLHDLICLVVKAVTVFKFSLGTQRFSSCLIATRFSASEDLRAAEGKAPWFPELILPRF
jgi:hypothetical protein